MKQPLLVSLLLTGIGVASLNGHSVFAFSPSDLQKLNTTGSCPGCDLSGADLSNRRFSKANLNGANLSNANLANTQFIESDLRGINVNGATVSKTYIWKGLVAANSFTPQQYNNLIFKEPTSAPWVEKVGLPFPEAPKPTPKDIFISLSNQGGYVAKWSLMYILPGKAAPVFEGGTLTLGMDKEIFIQPNAVGIVFAVDALGKIGDPNIFRQAIPSNSRNCFVLTGTIINPAKSLKADSDC